jgi:dinuclear metal center YbgI/SA1388 family protein
MLKSEIDTYFRGILSIDELIRTDSSLNGIQVDREGTEILRVAFAVDASLESFRRAVEWGGDMLFVHHGLSWGKPLALRGGHYHRLKYLIENNLSLYAAHLPLDMHPEFGNNAAMASALGLVEIEPFGEYKGIKIGFKGRLPEPMEINDILARLDLTREQCNGILPFGKQKISTVGLVSGGAPFEVEQAIEENLDLYITGDASHSIYHTCLEQGINVIFGGHYQTEVWGVKLLSRRLSADTGLATTFIDIPTGL